MKKYLFLLTIIISLPLFAQEMSKNAENREQDNCEVLIEQAEGNTDRSVYERCGFDDPVRAFEYWGPYVSNKNYRKALFELAVRHPEHEYAALYIRKSADNGYGPALVKVGHQAFAEGREEQAVSLYRQALQTNALSAEEQGEIAEKMGLIYLDSKSADFDFEKAISFIKQAAENRQALSNNILGFYAYTGEQNFPKNDRVALNYFWRAILMGCPAAEENVGVFHLARLNKIDRPTAIGYMRERLTSCTPPTFKEPSELEKQEQEKFIRERSACDCPSVMELADRLKRQPYILLSIKDDVAKLADSMSREYMVQEGQQMRDGTEILEVRKTAVIISKGGKRFVLNLYPVKCADLCSKPLPTANKSVQIKPYHITFTEQECIDLLAYARELVDINQPFVGKEECMSVENKQKDTAAIFSLLNQELDEAENEATSPEKEEVVSEKAEAAMEAVGIGTSRPMVTAEQIQAAKKAEIVQKLNLNTQKRAKRKVQTPQKLNPLNK